MITPKFRMIFESQDPNTIRVKYLTLQNTADTTEGKLVVRNEIVEWVRSEFTPRYGLSIHNPIVDDDALFNGVIEFLRTTIGDTFNGVIFNDTTIDLVWDNEHKRFVLDSTSLDAATSGTSLDRTLRAYKFNGLLGYIDHLNDAILSEANYSFKTGKYMATNAYAVRGVISNCVFEIPTYLGDVAKKFDIEMLPWDEVGAYYTNAERIVLKLVELEQARDAKPTTPQPWYTRFITFWKRLFSN